MLEVEHAAAPVSRQFDAPAPLQLSPPSSPRPPTPLPVDIAWEDADHEHSVRKSRARAKRTADRAAKTRKREYGPSTRNSERLRAKEPACYVDMSSKATRLKTLKNELANCTKELKNQVKRRSLLRAADLRAMAGTASLPAAAITSLDQVLAGSE